MTDPRQDEREEEATVQLHIGRPCCFCNYNGEQEEECLLDPLDTGTHCECWWDGWDAEERI